MAVARDHPYAQYNFVVDVGGGGDGVDAGFAEVHGLSADVDVIEYRTGNSKMNEPMLLPGITRYGPVTLRRGIIGMLTLWQWLDAVRSGNGNARRTVTVQLLNEDRTEVAMTWRLLRAWPRRHASGPLLATGTDVAIEELVLSCERIEVE